MKDEEYDVWRDAELAADAQEMVDAGGRALAGPTPSQGRHGLVYDVAVDQGRPGEGDGRGAMLEAERIGRAEGWSETRLDVFGPNARALYESLGCLVIHTYLTKPLS